MIQLKALARERGAAVLVALAVAGYTELAGAEMPSRRVEVGIDWTRGPGADSCITPQELVERTRARAPVEALLTLDPRASDFVLTGRIERRGDRFRVELSLRDARGQALGERTFESHGASCRALDEALVLSLVLLVETPRVLSTAEASESSPRERRSMRSSTDVLPELVPPLRAEWIPRDRLLPLRLPAPSPPRWELELDAGASMAVGFLPKPTMGATIGGVFRPPHLFPLALRGAAYPFGADVITVPGEGISVDGYEVGADACPFALSRGLVEALGCVGVHGAVLHATPLGPRSSSATPAFVVLPLRAEVRARLGGALDPYAAMAARFSPAPASFVYRASDGEARTSFAVPWATVELDLGFAWRALP